MSSLTRDEFELALDEVVAALTDNLNASDLYHDPRRFEQHVRDMLRQTLRESGLSPVPGEHSHAFPDMTLNGFGVEVKFTKNDTWLAVGNSIFESMRTPGVESVYIIYGKAGGKPEARWSRYEDCVTHVRVSHSPRFVIEMESERQPLFEHIGVDYETFAKFDDEQKMQRIRDYARSRLGAGERLWWLEPSRSMPVAIRFYVDLPDAERRVLRAEAALLCPQVCGPSRGVIGRRKYHDAVLYLLTHHGVLCHQARDLFSAGSVSQHIPRLSDGEPSVSRSLRDIENLMVDAAHRLDNALFEEYWGEGCEPDDRIPEWLRRADVVAEGWQPSRNLFRRVRLR